MKVNSIMLTDNAIAGETVRINNINNGIWENVIIIRKQQEPHAYDIGFSFIFVSHNIWHIPANSNSLIITA